MDTSTTAPAGGQQAGDGPQERAQQVAAQAQEKAQEAASQAKGRLREQLDQRSSQAAEQINEQASDLRSVSQSLREQGKDGPADVAERVAGYAERAGGYLRERDSDALLSDAEDFARRQPWAVAAGAMALGFAASRFLKASSGKRYSSRRAAAGSSPTPPPTPELATGMPGGSTPTGGVVDLPPAVGSADPLARPIAGA
jgi:gas vesicle protein